MMHRLWLTGALGVVGVGALAFTIFHSLFPPGPLVRHDLERIVGPSSGYATAGHGEWSSPTQPRRQLGTVGGLYTATLVMEVVDEQRLNLTPQVRTLLAKRANARLTALAATAASELPAALYFDRIVQPLELHQTSWDPKRGLVSTAHDLGRFASALIQGADVRARRVRQMTHGLVWHGPAQTACGAAYGWRDPRASVLVSPDGKRVAAIVGARASAVERLFCAV
jgi:hypothetical protein